MRYIRRKLEEVIRSFLDSPEILAIVGPRQAGKTTMLQELAVKMRGCKYITFEDPLVLGIAENKYRDFTSAYIEGCKLVIIDEFHYLEEGGKLLKYIYDKHKNNVKIIISGSSAIDLTVKTLGYLVGRIITFELFPFDFEEFVSAKDLAMLKLLRRRSDSEEAHEELVRLYEEYLLYGGYPRVATETDIQKKIVILKNIYSTLLHRDVRDFAQLIDTTKLQKLVTSLSLQTGQIIKYADLSTSANLSFQTLKKHLSFLEKAYICRFVPPFYTNKLTELVKNPKVYFYDTGLRNAVIDDFRRLEFRGDKGYLIENSAAAGLIKKGKAFNFWRNKQGGEVDFIINEGGRKYRALEIKTLLQHGKLSGQRSFVQSYPDIELSYAYMRTADRNVIRSKTYFPLYDL